MLRRLLAAYDCGAAEELRFLIGPQGKPTLHDGRLSFNLSHSGAVAIVAVAPGEVDLGIDVEHVRPMANMEKLVGRFFSPLERTALSSQPLERREAAFFRLWTRKEAFIKATGKGLTRPLDSFTVSLGEPPTIIKPLLPDWSLHHLEPAPDYVGTLAVMHPAPLLKGGPLAYLLGSTGAARR
jgi:4'-phosphopantetheinyl transferase